MSAQLSHFARSLSVETAFTVLAMGLVALRAHMLRTEAELDELRTEAASAGLLDDGEVSS